MMPLAWTDALVQGLLLLLAAGILLALQSIPSQIRRRRGRSSATSAQAHRHFVTGAQFLSRARSTSPPSPSLAKSALSHADHAISLSPRDAAPHILKALSLDLLGRRVLAIKSLNTALSPPLVNSLSDRERGDALFKRAELQLGLNQRKTRRAVADLTEAVRLSPDNAKALAKLGECYEERVEMENAQKAFETALQVDPSVKAAKEGLKRVTRFREVERDS
ncbi:TPR repeat [Carex littledalei]|uniref:TPR repeat n=1 Tax=Carex littledalei TaxID=544730 RepID=A0A833VC73_9POAL|nr:TPR repeat [Carex littledalei]